MGKEGGTLCLCGAEPTFSHSNGAEEETTAVRKVGGDKSWPRYGLGSGKAESWLISYHARLRKVGHRF
jgi:hypothetical protein